MRIIRIKTAADRIDVVSLTIRRWATETKYAHLKFPKLVDLGDNSVGLVEEEFDSWIAERAAKRDDEEDEDEQRAAVALHYGGLIFVFWMTPTSPGKDSDHDLLHDLRARNKPR